MEKECIADFRTSLASTFTGQRNRGQKAICREQEGRCRKPGGKASRPGGIEQTSNS